MDADVTILRSGRSWRRTPSTALRRPKPPIRGVIPVVLESNQENQNQNPNSSPTSTAQFGCNICLDTAKEPVVTQCGHLFCWPCLYRWVQLHSLSQDCPVCKSAVEVGPDATVTPIYGPGIAERVEDDGVPTVPPRPSGKRSIRPRGTPITDMIAEMLGYREQIQTLDRTRDAIDRVRTNLEAVEVLVREVSMRAARLGWNSVDRINRDIASEEMRRNGVPEMVDDGGDGVHRRTRRRRRRLAD